MVQINRETKRELGVAIQDFYKSVFEFNRIGGRTLHEDGYENHLQTVQEEALELQEGLEDVNLVELVDATCDCLFTAAFAVGIIDGNDDIIKNAPKYLNQREATVEDLIPEALTYLAEDNMVDFLGTCEDICAGLNADMPYCLDQVASSNLSKYPLVKDISDPDLVCDAIENENRYDNVTFEESTKFGEPCYVFKATVDKLHNKNYPQGKIVKVPKVFGYFDPSIVIYE